ncbi:MAG: LbetaH domain-containing protein [Planctomycetota bacterium]
MTTTNQVYPPPARRSVWTFRQKVIRLIWSTAGRAVWVCTAGLRPWLIRRFGGQVGPGCRFARSVDIIIPWNLHVGSNVEVGRDVILYTLGVITIGDGVVIDDLAHLCAGTHDYTDSRFPLVKPPITIGAGTFIGIDAYIAPGVSLGAGCRVWPRASVYRSFGDGTRLQGNPARPVSPEGEQTT